MKQVYALYGWIALVVALWMAMVCGAIGVVYWGVSTLIPLLNIFI
jgi:hypothetical protein